MDDISTFGDIVGRLSLAESIDQGLLADYRIVAIEVSEPELRCISTGTPPSSPTPTGCGWPPPNWPCSRPSTSTTCGGPGRA